MPPGPQRSLQREALAAFFVSRGGLFLFAWLGLLLAPEMWNDAGWRALPDKLWLDAWARWDSGWYWGIARDGYNYTPGRESNVNFFPLYPLLSWLVGAPFRWLLSAEQAFYLGGWLVSLTAFLLALLGLARLGEQVVGSAATRRALWLLALFPLSLFFGACYTESVFLALGVWAFRFAKQDRWPLAALLAGLAGALRMPGALVGIALGVEFLWHRRWRGPTGLRDTVAMALMPVPLGLHCLHLYLQFGDPLLFVHTATTTWGRKVTPWHMVIAVRDVFGTHSQIDRLKLLTYLTGTAGVFALGLRLLWRREVGLATFALASMTLAALSGADSLGRYASVLFPAFLELGLLTAAPWSFRLYLAFAVPLLLLFTHVFAHWGPIF